MSVYITLMVGLVWWITAWAFGIKAFDAFLLTAIVVVIAATARIVKPSLNQAMRRDTPAPSEPGPF